MANSVDSDQTAPIGAVQSVLGPHCLLLYLTCQYVRQLLAADI